MAGGLFRNALDRIFDRPAQPLAAPPASSYAMKKVNGSDCTCDAQGQITELRDAQGRVWKFAYKQTQLVRFAEPSGNIWMMEDGKWRAEHVKPGTPTPKAVAINHATGEIRIEDCVRLVAYLPDGTTQIEVTQSMDGKPVPVRFTEFPTRPNRSFVVVEKHDGKDYVTWIQDANAKLFKLEYESGKLRRFIDLSAKPTIVWQAQYDLTDTSITRWLGHIKGHPEQSVGEMQPVLQSVDLNGNRNYKSASGSFVVVDPSGTAFARKVGLESPHATGTFTTPLPIIQA